MRHLQEEVELHVAPLRIVRVLAQDELTELHHWVCELMGNGAKLAAMQSALDALNPMHAAEDIARDLLSLTDGHAVLENGGADGV